jgi:hypothetical protein
MEGTTQIIQLLSEIKGSLANAGSSNLMIALVAAGGTVAGVLVGGIFQYLLQRGQSKAQGNQLKNQLKAEIISKQRQEWMESIRSAAKDLIAEFDLIYNLVSGQMGPAKEEIKSLFLTTSRNAALIELKLNPEKSTQKAVIDSLLELQMHLQRHTQRPTREDDAVYNELRTKFKGSLVALFRQTWFRIKKLEDIQAT